MPVRNPCTTIPKFPNLDALSNAGVTGEKKKNNPATEKEVPSSKRLSLPIVRLHLFLSPYLLSIPQFSTICWPKTLSFAGYSHVSRQFLLPIIPISNPACYRSNFTTILPDSGAYWAAYEKISEANVHLNIFERLWAACWFSCSFVRRTCLYCF